MTVTSNSVTPVISANWQYLFTLFAEAPKVTHLIISSSYYAH